MSTRTDGRGQDISILGRRIEQGGAIAGRKQGLEGAPGGPWAASIIAAQIRRGGRTPVGKAGPLLGQGARGDGNTSVLVAIPQASSDRLSLGAPPAQTISLSNCRCAARMGGTGDSDSHKTAGVLFFIVLPFALTIPLISVMLPHFVILGIQFWDRPQAMSAQRLHQEGSLVIIGDGCSGRVYCVLERKSRLWCQRFASHF